MTILRRQIGKTLNRSLGEQQDWWLLCYDIENRDFFVEHRWQHIKNNRIVEEPNTGKERIILESFSGLGCDLVDGAMDEMLAEADWGSGRFL